MNKNKLIHLGRYLKRVWFQQWNKLKFRFLGVKIGKSPVFYGKVYLNMGINSKFTIGDNFMIFSGDNFNPLCSNVCCSINVADNAVLSIGNWSGMSGGRIWATERISIGNYVNIGANCIFMDGDIHNTDWRLRQHDRSSASPTTYKHKPIIIEDNVWIGANSIILKGVTIGARSIIGAGSVVTKDISSDSIAAGNPCKVIKKQNN